MAGENNPAPTPGANPTPAGNPAPTATPAPQPGNNPTPPAQNEFIMNQEQFNARWGEKMGELEKALGLEAGALKDPGSLKERIGQKKPATPPGEKLTGNDLRMAKMEILMEFDIPSKKIPLILENFNISGSTREELKARVQTLIDAKLLPIEKVPDPNPGNQPQNQTPTAAQGAGNNGVPANQQKKIWTEKEINELRHTGQYAAHRDEILQAQREGRIQ